MNTSANSSTETEDDVITIVIEDRRFIERRTVLVNAFGYFKAMLEGGYKESENGYVHLQNLDPSAFEEVITNGLYKGTINITTRNLHDILEVCCFLDIPKFVKDCFLFLEKNNLETDNIISVCKNAHLSGNTIVFNKIIECLAENFAEKSQLEDFSHLPLCIFEAILSHEKLDRQDDSVLLGIAKWTKKNSQQNLEETQKVFTAAKLTSVNFSALVKIFSGITDNEDDKSDVKERIQIYGGSGDAKIKIYLKATNQRDFNTFISMIYENTNRKWTLRENFKTSFKNFKTVVFEKQQYFLTYDENHKTVDSCCQFWMEQNGVRSWLREPPYISDQYDLVKTGNLIFLYLAGDEVVPTSTDDSPTSLPDKLLFYFNCDTEKWYSTPKMMTKVRGASLVSVSDPATLILLIGGLDDLGNNITWVQSYDCRSGKWDKLLPVFDLWDPKSPPYEEETLRYHRGSAIMYKNEIYLSSFEHDEYIIQTYDFGANKIQAFPRPEVARGKHHALVVYKNDLFAIDNEPISNVDKYNFTSCEWKEEAPIPKKIVSGNRVILTGDVTAATVVADYYR